jgi:hypothetical protein
MIFQLNFFIHFKKSFFLYFLIKKRVEFHYSLSIYFLELFYINISVSDIKMGADICSHNSS